jgi:hypothetical protein
VAALLMLGREPWYTRFDTTEVGVLTESMVRRVDAWVFGARKVD